MQSVSKRFADHKESMESLMGHYFDEADGDSPTDLKRRGKEVETGILASLQRTNRLIGRLFYNIPVDRLADRSATWLEQLEKCLLFPSLVRGPDARAWKFKVKVNRNLQAFRSQANYARHLHEAKILANRAAANWSSGKRKMAMSEYDRAVGEKLLADGEPLPICFMTDDEYVVGKLEMLKTNMLIAAKSH